VGNDIKQYFTDKVIKVDRGGPESRIGKLLDATDDYFAVFTENDGVVYYHTRHIKSFTENMKGKLEFDIDVPKDFEFKKAENFKELLESLKYIWVRINRDGPDSVEGVLTDVKDDFVYVITNEEIVRITIFHIKNVSYGVQIEKTKSEDHKSREHKLRPHKSIQHESIQHESVQHESSPYESGQESNDESKNKYNKTDMVNRQNFEDDLLVLLSSMEKFLRNYSN
jgi:hypothetical protein